MSKKASKKDTSRTNYPKEEIVPGFGVALLRRQIGIMSEDNGYQGSSLRLSHQSYSTIDEKVNINVCRKTLMNVE
jgi:hypothetical protein